MLHYVRVENRHKLVYQIINESCGNGESTVLWAHWEKGFTYNDTSLLSPLNSGLKFDITY